MKKTLDSMKTLLDDPKLSELCCKLYYNQLIELYYKSGIVIQDFEIKKLQDLGTNKNG